MAPPEDHRDALESAKDLVEVGHIVRVTACISGWAMLNDQTAIVPDIEVDPRIPLDAYRPTFVRSLLTVPVGSPTPIAAVGAYWSKARRATDVEVGRLEDLAR